MNSTALASRCRWLSRELSEEARRWNGKRRKDLTSNALQLAHVARTVTRQPPAVTQAVIDAATNVLAIAMSQRGFATINQESKP